MESLLLRGGEGATDGQQMYWTGAFSAILRPTCWVAWRAPSQARPPVQATEQPFVSRILACRYSVSIGYSSQLSYIVVWVRVIGSARSTLPAKRQLLRDAEKLGEQASTAGFLDKHIKTVKHIGKFVLPQVLPVHYLLGLCNCHPARAAEAPILAARRSTTRNSSSWEWTRNSLICPCWWWLCNMGWRHWLSRIKQLNVHDFMLAGQLL